MDEDQLKQIFTDDTFVQELFTLASAEEVGAALKAKGLYLGDSGIYVIRDLLSKLHRGDITRNQLENGEMPEEVLEQIVGGRISLGSAVVSTLVACMVADVAFKKREGNWLSGG